MTAPRFSIGIVTCNRPEYLSEAIRSCLRQTVAPFEIVVVNDGGHKASSEVVNEINADAIRLFEIPASGRPGARNRVLKEFLGDYLVWLDDDDALLPWCLETHLEMISEDPATDVSYGSPMVCNADLIPREMHIKRTIRVENTLYDFFISNPIPNPSTAISRRCIEKVGLYDLRLPRAQDYDYFVRIACVGGKFNHVNRPICLYRSHRENAAVRTNSKKHTTYPAEVMMGILTEYPLLQIFPWNSWQSDPESAIVSSLSTIACSFMKLGALEKIRKVLEEIILPRLNGKGRFYEVIAFYREILQILRGVDARAEIGLLKNHPLFFNPLIEQLVAEYLDFFLSPTDRNQLRAELLMAKYEKCGPASIFPDIVSETGGDSEADKERLARIKLMGSLVRFEQVQRAREVQFETSAVEHKEIDELIQRMLSRYQLFGDDPRPFFRRSRIFYRPEVQEIYTAIGSSLVNRARNELEENLAGDGVLSSKWQRLFSWTQEQYASDNEQRQQEAKSALERAGNQFLEAQGLICGRIREPSRGNLGEKAKGRVVLHNAMSESRSRVISVIVWSEGEHELLSDTLENLSVVLDDVSEVVVVSSKEILEPQRYMASLSAKGIPFKMIVGNYGMGRASAINDAILASSGQWLYMLDAGHVVSESYSAYADACSVGGTEANLVFGPRYQQSCSYGYPVNQRVVSISAQFFENLLIDPWQLGSGGYFISRELFMQLGGYREDCGEIADYHLLLRTLFRAKPRQLEQPIFYERVQLEYGFRKVDKQLAVFSSIMLAHSCLAPILTISSAEQRNQLHYAQRAQAYAAVEKYIRSGGSRGYARQIIELWWKLLLDSGERGVCEAEKQIAGQCIPQLMF